MKRFRKVYLEISNLCNLNCRFCPGTSRNGKRMTREEFTRALELLKPWTDYLYFHLMGEPLCHPELANFLTLAAEAEFRVILTTNGTLLKTKEDTLLAAPALHKINISLHAFEANDLSIPFSQYLKECFAFAKAAEDSKIVCLRLWNQGGEEERNQEILDQLQQHFPKPWVQERNGLRIGQRIYLEYGDKFDWPDLSASDNTPPTFCYGLRDHIGVLCDGSVVPCCLDHNGDLTLGNLFDQPLEDILNSPMAKAIFDGFSNGIAAEELCRKCGYARRFS